VRAQGLEAKPRRNRGPAAAVENRHRLLDAARAVFAERGIDAPLNEIAQRAEVGQGTLYRHFPDRLSLVLAVFDDNMDHLEAIVRRPEATVDDLLAGVAEQSSASAALVQLGSAERDDPRLQRLGVRLIALGEALTSGGGQSRASEAQPGDIVLAVQMLALSLVHVPQDQRDAAAARMRTMLAAWFEPR